MKYSAAVAVAAAVLASGVAARPSITNSEINPKEGEPFTLTFTGCDSGCTVTLQQGPDPGNLRDIRTLTSNTRNEFTVSLSNLGSGTYNFKVNNNSDGSEPNYSTPFEYTGTGPTSFGGSSASATSTATSASSADSSSTDSPSTGSSSTDSSSTTGSDSSLSSTTGTNSSTSATTSATSTNSASRTRTSSSASGTGTTPPNSGAGSLAPLGLAAAGAAALLL